MGYDYRIRLEIKKIIFESKDLDEVSKSLSSTNTNLLYFPKALRPKIDLQNIGLTLFFENQEIEVWKIN